MDMNLQFNFKDRVVPSITPGLEFDEDAHRYTWKGRPVPSVSDILRPYRDFSMIPAADREANMSFGSKGHEALFLQDIDDLDMDALDPMLLPYINGWKKYKEEHGLDGADMLAEVSLCSDHCGYAGTIDRLFATPKHDLLIDFKFGSPHRATGVQLAGYGRLLLSMGLVRLDRLRMIELTFGPDGTAVERSCRYSTHLNIFNSLHAAYNFFVA